VPRPGSLLGLVPLLFASWAAAESTPKVELVLFEEPSVSAATALQYRNVGLAEGNGAETEVRVPLPHGTVARSAYSLQDARDDRGRLLGNSPKHLANARVLFPLAYGVDGGPEFLIVGSRRTRDGRHVETSPILNLSLTYATPIRNLGLTAGLYNLLDRTYADPAGPQLRQDGIAQDGFGFRVQVQYAF
jgi:outer membrane receptor protein involved in Fe transport